MNIYFDVFAVGAASIFVLLFIGASYYFKRWNEPYIYVSDLSAYKTEKPSLKQRLAQFPRYFLLASLILFLAAYIDPHRFISKTPDSNQDAVQNKIPTEGIAIYLVLDNSQSMLEELKATFPNGETKSVPKIDVLKEVTKDFVKGNSQEGLKGRTNDLIGIVSFSRSAHVLSPLTLDHETIVHVLENLNVSQDKSQLGTVLGYALFKSANLIEATRYFGKNSVQEGDPAYSIKNSVIVLVTDGFQEVNPNDYTNPLRSIELDDAMNYAKDLGIRVYMINIDPKITFDRYANYREYFKLLTEMTGGKFFYLDSTTDLAKVYRAIDQLEKSTVPSYFKQDFDHLPHLYERLSFYPYFIALGLFCLGVSVSMQAVLRRCP